jgi:arginyl-tRNA--protein-N-Asp/Glu arginylyltransferase
MASKMPVPRRLSGDPPEWLIHDAPGPCVYLPEETAQLPLRLPTRRLNRVEFSRRLAEGDRRQGRLLYRPRCPTCRACEPIRIDVNEFRPNRTQRRVFRRGELAFRAEIGEPALTSEKVALYNRHKHVRNLMAREEPMDEASYAHFLVETCTDTFEIRYYRQDQLVGISVTDRGADALSAVYFYFDPSFERLSPGTHSILQQIQLCRRWGLQYLYLGLYVAGCRSMAYKSSYLPHERLIAGEWRRFDRT